MSFSSLAADIMLPAQSYSTLAARVSKVRRVSVMVVRPRSGLASRRTDKVRAQSLEREPTADMGVEVERLWMEWMKDVVGCEEKYRESNG